MSAICESAPSWEVLYSTGEPIEGECVEFRLLYAGNQLVSDGSPAYKQVIRRAFHPQLRQLWKSNFKLSELARLKGGPLTAGPVGSQIPNSPDDQRRAFFNHVGALYERGGFHFVPLVEQEACLRASLDILFLRPDQHPLIKQGGDIDNRLKTLFDALRVPETTAGLGGTPGADEDPFFVLLQDDCLISEIRVNTDNLLMLPQNRQLDAKDTFLVIDVKLQPTVRNAASFTFD